jgi:hypothetical protein
MSLLIETRKLSPRDRFVQNILHERMTPVEDVLQSGDVNRIGRAIATMLLFLPEEEVIPIPVLSATTAAIDDIPLRDVIAVAADVLTRRIEMHMSTTDLIQLLCLCSHVNDRHLVSDALKHVQDHLNREAAAVLVFNTVPFFRSFLSRRTRLDIFLKIVSGKPEKDQHFYDAMASDPLLSYASVTDLWPHTCRDDDPSVDERLESDEGFMIQSFVYAHAPEIIG